MSATSQTSSFGKGQFNTLAQSGTGLIIKKQIIVNGNGTELSNRKALLGRSKKKMITSKLILSLVDIAKKKKKPERIKAYWNTYHCQRRVYSSEGKLYGNYCKNRFCNTCCGIRKAEIINKYLPVISKWSEPFFVTLTAKAVSNIKLKKRMFDVLRAFKIIKDKYRKLHLKGRGIKLVGIKSLECNFNPISKTYNPHLHFIVPNKEIADILLKEWLSLWTRKFANPAAQKSIKVDNIEYALIEIIKYSSKIFTDPEMIKKSKPKIPAIIYVSALDNIIWAMKDNRIFDRFGFNLPFRPAQEECTPIVLYNYQEWKYSLNQSNWIDAESEQKLSEYEPTDELMRILEMNIDKDRE